MTHFIKQKDVFGDPLSDNATFSEAWHKKNKTYYIPDHKSGGQKGNEERNRKDKKQILQWKCRRAARRHTAFLILHTRLVKKLTQKQLADLVGTQQGNIARIERGRAVPSLEFLLKMAAVLDTKLLLPTFAFLRPKA